MNQKGFVQYLVIVLLLTGIGVGVYLTQFTQIFKPKALENITLTSGLYGSTPLGEIDNYPKSQNHIKIFSHLGYNYPNQVNGPEWGLTDAKKNFLAKEMDYFMYDFGDLSQINGQYDLSNIFKVAKEMKQLNSNLKVGIYGGGMGNTYAYAQNYPALIEEDFLHYINNPSQRINQDDTGSTGVYFTNIANNATRGRIVNKWKQIFNDHPEVDGVLFDSTSTYANFPHLQSGCVETGCETHNFWIGNMHQLGHELVNALPDKDLFYNPFTYVDESTPYYLGPMNSGFMQYLKGGFDEGMIQLYSNPAALKRYLEIVPGLAAQGKKLFFLALPIADPSQVMNLDLERYYLAAFLLFNDNQNTYFGYQPQGYDGNDKLYFYKDWNLDFGLPGPAAAEIGVAGLWWRVYQNGIVVVNSTTSPQNFTFPAQNPGFTGFREWDPYSAQAIPNNVSIPPKSGKFYFFPKQSHSPSPSTAKKPGDIDNDGDVDIFDFNTFVTDFPIKNLRSDLDGNGKVDIFDFNLLVQNFGK